MTEPQNDDRNDDADELKMPDVSPEEALAAFMRVNPEKVREAEERERSGDRDDEGEENE